ncbi:MAG: DNA polymerase III subunit delta' [Deltaproteobacteria bacterium]|nr:DNA polymerase III subunit delta' [Deltaproteobacteria bacterium]
MGFDQIIGHERPISLLKAMLASGRLPHALLISGPTGVGKASLAKLVAMAANCLGADPANPCGVCRACDKIRRGLHPDVSEIAPEGRARIIKIETIRELRGNVAFKPYEGRTKVYIIRDANRLHEAAANALLKTLEEPPPDSLLILTAPEETDLLPTIVSRCLRLKLAPLPKSTIEAWLRQTKGMTGPIASFLTALSEGCIGRINEMDGEVLWAYRGDIYDHLTKLVNVDDLDHLLKWAAQLSGETEKWPDFYSMARLCFRDLMLAAGGVEDRHLVNLDLTDRIADMVAARSVQNYIKALEHLERAEDALNRFIRPDLVFEDLLLSLGGVA